MENWDEEEVKKLGVFVKEYGIADGAEDELIELSAKFVLLCREYQKESSVQRQNRRNWFLNAQKTFFETGAIMANELVKTPQEEGAQSIEMQTDEPLQGTNASAVGASGAIARVNKEDSVEELQWLPYVQYRKILQPCLELEIGNLTNNTMSDINHAVEMAKRQATAFDYHIAGAEQAILAIIHAKLDPVSKGIWEFQLATMEPTIETFDRFLGQRAYMVQSELGQVTPVGEPNTRRKTQICIYCKNASHTIYKCSAGFESLTIPAKKQFLRKEDRCENCFMRHPVDICTAGTCWTCKVQHNSMLCPKNPKNL